MKRLTGALVALSLLLTATAAGAPPRRDLEERLADLAQQITRELGENQKRTIAVVEFGDLRGRVNEFGRFLAEELITRLHQTKKFKVIERQLLNKVVTEQKLSLTGIIDQKSAQQLGRLLGVDAIASGTVTDLGRSMKVNARLISTETGEIFATAAADFPKDEAVLNLIGRAEESAAPAPTSPSSSAPAHPKGATVDRPAQLRVESSFLTVEVQRCRKSGASVICDLALTNNEADREIGLGSMTKLYDDLGNAHPARHVRIANVEGRNSAYATLVTGVRTSVQFLFEDVSPQATKVSMLDVYVALRGPIRIIGAKDFHIQFRNFPLVQ